MPVVTKMTTICGKEVIDRSLHHLDAKQLKNVIARCQMILLTRNPDIDNDDPDEEMFFDAMQNRFPGKNNHFNEFKMRHIYKMFHTNFPEVSDYVHQYYEDLDHDKKLKLNAIMCHALYDYMDKLNMDLTYKGVSIQMSKMAFVMERSFPFYADAGMLPGLLDLPSSK